MQLSSKIIKNFEVSDCSDESLINTINLKPKISEQSPSIEDENRVDLDAIKNEIRQEMLSEINLKRSKILKDATYEADQLKLKTKELAFKEGYEKGYQSGLTEAEKKGAVIKDNAIALIEQAKIQVDEYFAKSRNQIIKLAAEMAESIVHLEVETSKEGILTLIKPILRRFQKNESITITCHPDCGETLNKKVNELEEVCPDTKFFILKDKNIENNGCIIENEHQIVDLQIKKQINSILKEINNLE